MAYVYDNVAWLDVPVRGPDFLFVLEPPSPLADQVQGDFELEGQVISRRSHPKEAEAQSMALLARFGLSVAGPRETTPSARRVSRRPRRHPVEAPRILLGGPQVCGARTLAQDFQKMVFGPRNRILHSGYTEYAEADALRCYSIANLGLQILARLDKAKRAFGYVGHGGA